MENTNPTPEQKPKKGGKWKIIVGVLVVVVIVGAVVLGAQGGLFQGKIFRFNAPVETIKTPVETIKVEKAVTVKDVTIATPEAPADEPADEPEDEPTEGPLVIPTVTVTKSVQSPSGSRVVNVNDSLASFNVCAEDNDMIIKGINFKVDSYSLGSFGDIVITDGGGGNYSTTNYINTAGNVPLYITVYTSNDIVIGEGTCKTLSFETNTVEFLRDSVGGDAPLQISIHEFITGTLTSYGNSFPVEANELLYQKI